MDDKGVITVPKGISLKTNVNFRPVFDHVSSDITVKHVVHYATETTN